VERSGLKIILLIITISSLRIFKRGGRIVAGLTKCKSNLRFIFLPGIKALKYISNYRSSPELVTGNSDKTFLLAIRKLPPTWRVPRLISRPKFRNSRSEFADVT
jgi:hypothetical protein